MSNIRINYQFKDHKRLIIITDTENKIEFRAEANMVLDTASAENWIAEAIDRYIFIKNQKKRCEPSCKINGIEKEDDGLLLKFGYKVIPE